MTELMTDIPLRSPEAIAELAHELRSPLGGIESMAELLATTTLSPEQARMVAALQASAQHLRAITSRVLGRRAGGDIEAEKDLNAILQAISASAAARASVKGLDFACGDITGLEGLDLVAPTAFRQVVENLIDNAIRMTEQGHVALGIERAGDRIAICVADDGPGIASDQVAARIAGDKDAPSRGLGLPISGRLVARHGGRLEAAPREGGRGSLFRFDWPLEQRAKGDGAILIVEDHPASRLVLRTILAAFGFACREAANLDEAQAILAEGPFAAVFTDLRLGEEDGRSLVRLLGEADGSERPAICVISADEIAADDPCACWIKAAVLKPISVQAVAGAIRAMGLKAPKGGLRAAG
jgi:CheY-like chemotaxis protein/anti-sigma regulatory factor (Ser/Thr protein kinase)